MFLLLHNARQDKIYMKFRVALNICLGCVKSHIEIVICLLNNKNKFNKGCVTTRDKRGNECQKVNSQRASVNIPL